MTTYHLHLVSDSTGETIGYVARACLGQFADVQVVEHVWGLVRGEHKLEQTIAGIAANPGLVFFTLLDGTVRSRMEAACSGLGVPYVSILDPMMAALERFLGTKSLLMPGRQHALNDDYFRRMHAIQFTLAHDDGQMAADIDKADIVIVGVSRASKTLISMYLASHGYKVANIPFVRDMQPPQSLLKAENPLIVGLTRDPRILVDIRHTRLNMSEDAFPTEYTDLPHVAEEVAKARRLFSEHNWPVVDSTSLSIEEAASAIIQLHARRKDVRGASDQS